MSKHLVEALAALRSDINRLLDGEALVGLSINKRRILTKEIGATASELDEFLRRVTPVDGKTIRNRLEFVLSRLASDTAGIASFAKARTSKDIRAALASIEETASRALTHLDPVALPDNIFDPTSPDVSAWTVVLALIAQPKVKLSEIAPQYGAGVYALYYDGEHPLYRCVSGSETPIYVGKSDPKKGAGIDIRTQGATLTGRLADHRRQLRMAEAYSSDHAADLEAMGLSPLNVDDFFCRKLVCATNIQLTAERRLIALFRPLWNSDFEVAHGISKHGDRQRRHPKSPWDVVHPGRPWADGLKDNGTPFEDQLSPAQVAERIADHLPSMKIYARQQDIVDAVLDAFAQRPATADPELAESLEEAAEAIGASVRPDD